MANRLTRPQRQPDIEINKPESRPPWQRPGVVLTVYAVAAVMLFLYYQYRIAEQRLEIPYSEFL